MPRYITDQYHLCDILALQLRPLSYLPLIVFLISSLNGSSPSSSYVSSTIERRPSIQSFFVTVKCQDVTDPFHLYYIHSFTITFPIVLPLSMCLIASLTESSPSNSAVSSTIDCSLPSAKRPRTRSFFVRTVL